LRSDGRKSGRKAGYRTRNLRFYVGQLFRSIDATDDDVRREPLARPPLPPFTAETAAQKVRLAEDAWNTRDPARIALAYTVDSIWRNRAEFIHGHEEIEAFLACKWNRERDYRLIKEVWTFRENRIAVRFA
jgi:hypothetical protein